MTYVADVYNATGELCAWNVLILVYPSLDVANIIRFDMDVRGR